MRRRSVCLVAGACRGSGSSLPFAIAATMAAAGRSSRLQVAPHAAVMVCRAEESRKIDRVVDGRP